jgi:hypothetical protein
LEGSAAGIPVQTNGGVQHTLDITERGLQLHSILAAPTQTKGGTASGDTALVCVPPTVAFCNLLSYMLLTLVVSTARS